MSRSNHPPRKPVSKLEKLNSLYPRLIKRLETRAAELGLPKSDLLFLTTKESIFALKREYELSIIIREEFVFRDFIRQVTVKILSLYDCYRGFFVYLIPNFRGRP